MPQAKQTRASIHRSRLSVCQLLDYSRLGPEAMLVSSSCDGEKRLASAWEDEVCFNNRFETGGKAN